MTKSFSSPTKAFPGIWEIPVNIHYVNDLGGGRCSYLDQCVFAHFTSDDVFEWIQEDFNRNYKVNLTLFFDFMKCEIFPK
jgi:hypothetical protein